MKSLRKTARWDDQRKIEVIIDLYKVNWIHEFLTIGYSLTSLNSINWACSFFRSAIIDHGPRTFEGFYAEIRKNIITMLLSESSLEIVLDSLKTSLFRKAFSFYSSTHSCLLLILLFLAFFFIVLYYAANRLQEERNSVEKPKVTGDKYLQLFVWKETCFGKGSSGFLQVFYLYSPLFAWDCCGDFIWLLHARSKLYCPISRLLFSLYIMTIISHGFGSEYTGIEVTKLAHRYLTLSLSKWLFLSSVACWIAHIWPCAFVHP